MLQKIIVMSREQAIQVRLESPFYAIQLLGLCENPYPELPGAERVLQLRLDDVHEGTEGLVLPAGHLAWPATEAIEAEQELYSGYRERVLLPGLDHARRIVTFAREAHAASTPADLLVHCWGGLSRSVAVGEFLADRLGVAMDRRSRPWGDAPNPRLRRLLAQAWAQEK